MASEDTDAIVELTANKGACDSDAVPFAAGLRPSFPRLRSMESTVASALPHESDAFATDPDCADRALHLPERIHDHTAPSMFSMLRSDSLHDDVAQRSREAQPRDANICSGTRLGVKTLGAMKSTGGNTGHAVTLNSRPVEEWTAEDVQIWAASLPQMPVEVVQILREHNVTGANLPKAESELDHMGIKRFGWRRRLMLEISILLEKSPNTSVTSNLQVSHTHANYSLCQHSPESVAHSRGASNEVLSTRFPGHAHVEYPRRCAAKPVGMRIGKHANGNRSERSVAKDIEPRVLGRTLCKVNVTHARAIEPKVRNSESRLTAKVDAGRVDLTAVLTASHKPDAQNTRPTMDNQAGVQHKIRESRIHRARIVDNGRAATCNVPATSNKPNARTNDFSDMSSSHPGAIGSTSTSRAPATCSLSNSFAPAPVSVDSFIGSSRHCLDGTACVTTSVSDRSFSPVLVMEECIATSCTDDAPKVGPTVRTFSARETSISPCEISQCDFSTTGECDNMHKYSVHTSLSQNSSPDAKITSPAAHKPMTHYLSGSVNTLEPQLSPNSAHHAAARVSEQTLTAPQLALPADTRGDEALAESRDVYIDDSSAMSEVLRLINYARANEALDALLSKYDDVVGLRVEVPHAFGTRVHNGPLLEFHDDKKHVDPFQVRRARSAPELSQLRLQWATIGDDICTANERVSICTSEAPGRVSPISDPRTYNLSPRSRDISMEIQMSKQTQSIIENGCKTLPSAARTSPSNVRQCSPTTQDAFQCSSEMALSLHRKNGNGVSLQPEVPHARVTCDGHGPNFDSLDGEKSMNSSHMRRQWSNICNDIQTSRARVMVSPLSGPLLRAFPESIAHPSTERHWPKLTQSVTRSRNRTPPVPARLSPSSTRECHPAIQDAAHCWSDMARPLRPKVPPLRLQSPGPLQCSALLAPRGDSGPFAAVSSYAECCHAQVASVREPALAHVVRSASAPLRFHNMDSPQCSPLLAPRGGSGPPVTVSLYNERSWSPTAIVRVTSDMPAINKVAFEPSQRAPTMAWPSAAVPAAPVVAMRSSSHSPVRRFPPAASQGVSSQPFCGVACPHNQLFPAAALNVPLAIDAAARSISAAGNSCKYVGEKMTKGFLEDKEYIALHKMANVQLEEISSLKKAVSELAVAVASQPMRSVTAAQPPTDNLKAHASAIASVLTGPAIVQGIPR